MSEISVDRIMRNIYGTSATGSVGNMTGGFSIPKISFKSYAEMRPLPNIRYLDAEPIQHDGELDLELPYGSMTGGKRKQASKKKQQKKAPKRRAASESKENVIIYASPEYMTHTDLNTFIDKFFMNYRVSRSPNSAIYLVPPTKELHDMINKRGNYPEGSVEMQNAVRSNNKLEYDRYLFVTFGNNSKSDTYRIDPELTSPSAYPNSSFGTIRRTNLRGEVFYFTCGSNMKVKIHTTPKNVNDGTEIKFVGRFNNGGYVFQGALPGESIEKIAPKKENKKKHRNINKMMFGEMPSSSVSTSMTGGAVNTSLKVLEKYDHLYNGDHELASEHFLRCAAKANKLDNKYRNNGDMLYSAIYFALSEPAAVDENQLCEESDENMFDSFKPVVRGEAFRKKVKNAVEQLNRIYKRNERKGSLNDYIKTYKKIYQSEDVAKMTADIMVGYIRNNDTFIDSSLINNLHATFSGSNEGTRPFAQLIKNAVNSCPLPSAFGAEFMPIVTKMNSFESDMKAKKGMYETEGERKLEPEGEENKNIPAEMFAAKQKDNNNVDIELVMQDDLTGVEQNETLGSDDSDNDFGQDAMKEIEINDELNEQDDIANFF